MVCDKERKVTEESEEVSTEESKERAKKEAEGSPNESEDG